MNIHYSDEDLFEASEKSYVSDDESLLKKSDPPIDNEVEPSNFCFI